MLSHNYWMRRFAGDPGVLNRTITLNGLPMTIVGVTPPGFYGIVVGENPDVMVPVMMKAQMTPTWDDLQNRAQPLADGDGAAEARRLARAGGSGDERRSTARSTSRS